MTLLVIWDSERKIIICKYLRRPVGKRTLYEAPYGQPDACEKSMTINLMTPIIARVARAITLILC